MCEAETIDILRRGQLIAIKTILSGISICTDKNQCMNVIEKYKDQLKGEQYQVDANADHLTSKG